MSRRDRGIPYPDTEAFWVTLSADAIAGIVSWADPAFARLSAEHQQQRAANEAAAQKSTERRSR